MYSSMCRIHTEYVHSENTCILRVLYSTCIQHGLNTMQVQVNFACIASVLFIVFGGGCCDILHVAVEDAHVCGVCVAGVNMDYIVSMAAIPLSELHFSMGNHRGVQQCTEYS